MKRNTLRSLVIAIALLLAMTFVGVSGAQRRANSRVKPVPPESTTSDCPPTDVDADSALTMLMTGNEHRWRGTMAVRNWADEREKTATCQRPYAVVVSCMDSRVPPELIFDQGLGNIFVIRVAGPVMNSDELASLEYALAKMNVKLVVVLGHTDCGAVKGAVDRAGGSYLPGLLRKIEPAVTYVSDHYNGGRRITSKNKEDLTRVSIANSRIVASEIPTFGQSGVRVTWGLYETATGKVDLQPIEPWK
jgi:carbonic anhydrase